MSLKSSFITNSRRESRRVSRQLIIDTRVKRMVITINSRVILYPSCKFNPMKLFWNNVYTPVHHPSCPDPVRRCPVNGGVWTSLFPSLT